LTSARLNWTRDEAMPPKPGTNLSLYRCFGGIMFAVCDFNAG
jgi:hypothetical protein